MPHCRSTLLAALALLVTPAATYASAPLRHVSNASDESSNDRKDGTQASGPFHGVPTESRDRPREIDYDDLRIDLPDEAPFDPGWISIRIKKLHGTKVKIRGYILGLSVTSVFGNKSFVLVRDSHEVFPWPIWNNISVRMRHGNAATFTTRPVTVYGMFRVLNTRIRPHGRMEVIYAMEALKIEY